MTSVNGSVYTGVKDVLLTQCEGLNGVYREPASDGHFN